MLEHRGIEYEFARLGSYCLDLLLLLAGYFCIFVLLVFDFGAIGAFSLSLTYIAYYAVTAFILTILLGIRERIIRRGQASYQQATLELLRFFKLTLLLYLVLTLLYIVYPVYASGLSCPETANRCYISSPMPLMMNDFGELMVLALTLSMLALWTFCNALFLRFVLKPHAVFADSRKFWICYLLALNFGFYLTWPRAMDLLGWIVD